MLLGLAVIQIAQTIYSRISSLPDYAKGRFGAYTSKGTIDYDDWLNNQDVCLIALTFACESSISRRANTTVTLRVIIVGLTNSTIMTWARLARLKKTLVRHTMNNSLDSQAWALA